MEGHGGIVLASGYIEHVGDRSPCKGQISQSEKEFLAARWATPASFIYAAAAGDEQADLGVARVGFSELQLGAAAAAAAFFRSPAQWRARAGGG